MLELAHLALRDVPLMLGYAFVINASLNKVLPSSCFSSSFRSSIIIVYVFGEGQVERH